MLLTGVAVGLYLVLSLALFLAIRARNNGHFLFALDDPYIHLALSDGIAHGHYGINPGEFSSPSSSVLWPYLLAPFAASPLHPYTPLLLNLLAGIGVATLAAGAVVRWPTPAGSAAGPSLEPSETWRRIISVVALVFIANLLGLTFIGMEHTLQVLLAGAGAWAIVACLRGEPIPLWSLIAVALGPSVRYENLGVTLAVAIALLGQRRLGRGAALLAFSLAPVLGFSVYLHHLGLPWVPTSVLVKSRVQSASGLKQSDLQQILDNLGRTFTEPQRLLVLILFLTLALLAWRERERVRRFAFAGSAATAGLHLLVGRFDWFHRYEVYIVFFSALVVLQVVHERSRGLLGWYALGLLGCCFPYVQAFHDVVLCANQVYRQQYQTHRFLNDFYTGNVAVNDLGLVSYRRRPGMYVLDLWGLASAEVAQQPHRTTAWMDAIVRTHHVGLVVIYPLWFPPPPPDWTPLGEICLSDTPVVLGNACVSYYATPEAPAELEGQFDAFIRTLPVGTTIRPPDGPPFYR